MPIRFFCPMGHRLAVPASRAGKKGRCPVCHQKVIVPVPNPTPSGRPKIDPNDPILIEGMAAMELGLDPDDVMLVPMEEEPSTLPPKASPPDLSGAPPVTGPANRRPKAPPPLPPPANENRGGRTTPPPVIPPAAPPRPRKDR
jgi:hypothetical protein